MHNALPKEAAAAYRYARPALPVRPLWRMLRALYDSLPAAYAARRQYEQLRSTGITHESAIRRALGVACDADRSSR